MVLPGAKILTLVGLVSFCSNWQFGFQITYINTASRNFYELANKIYAESIGKNATTEEMLLPKGLWSQEWSTIVSAFYAGTLIGFILVPRLIRKTGGVRNALLCSSVPAVLGCFLQLGVRLSTSNLFFDLILSLGRLLIGIQAGCSLCLLPLFIIETSAFAHRPFLSSLQQVFQSLATFIGLIVGSDSLLDLGPLKLEWLQMISLVPTLFFIFFLIWLPETPFRLLEKCQSDEAIGQEEKLELAFERSSLFYYGSRADFGAIRDEAFHRWRIPQPHQQSKKHRPFMENIKGLLIGTMASISFTFTADDLIDSYSAEFLYRSSDATNSTGETLTTLLGLLLFGTSVFGALLVDNFGRRQLLISGLLGTALSNALAAFGATLGSIQMVTIGFAFTKTFIGFGAGAPAWFLTSELVSPLFVAQAQAISTGSLLITTGLSALSFLSIQVWIGSAGALLCLSSIPALFIAFILFLMLPETRGQPFEQIRHLMSKHALPGLARHPKWSKALLPLLDDEDGEEERENAKSLDWERSWQLPHRSQRLMSSSSYVSYGSIYSPVASPMVLNNGLCPPPLFRRHSENPATSQQQNVSIDEIHRHLQQPNNNKNNDTLLSPPPTTMMMARSSTFNSPTTMGNDEHDEKSSPFL